MSSARIQFRGRVRVNPMIRVGANPIIPGWMQLTALYRAGNRKEGEGKRVYKLLLA